MCLKASKYAASSAFAVFQEFLSSSHSGIPGGIPAHPVLIFGIPNQCLRTISCLLKTSASPIDNSRGVKPASKDYVLTDGDGLQLRVRSNGSLLWNFNYREPVTKKRINIGFGTYPELSLANARKKAVEARELLTQGIDPKVQRNTLNEAKRAETEHTFENVATAWFELKKDSVTPAYAEDICSGQLIPDTVLSFSSAFAGASPSLNWWGRVQL